jgi:cyclopropane fatty-acyl-phospholipid synthase-like methyltransferase
MPFFTQEQIAEYYDRTQIHYQRAWDLNHSLAMHYGYTDDEVRDFRPSLANMNRQMAHYAEIKAGERVLDAGCGVGGSAIFLAKSLGCEVSGISLSEAQIKQAQQNAMTHQVEDLLSFSYQDFTQTTFSDASFDVIWGLESIVHQKDKSAFLREAKRILKPGGRIILGEYIKVPRVLNAKEEALLNKWLEAWAVAPLARLTDFAESVRELGFTAMRSDNITKNIRQSSWRMFYGSFFLAVLSRLYRWYNPQVSFFADNHYKGLYYQYPALRKKLWDYYLICITK